MGHLMRRYWVPACLSSDLEAGGDPRRIRLLGENLVAFRDKRGTAGLMDENCPHRGASLALARSEECGLRCLYHGWLISPEGRVLEAPPEPEDLRFNEKIRAHAYPVDEAGGILWTFMGAAGLQPPHPDFEFMTLPQDHVLVMRAAVRCNWAQVLEGILDSSHSNYLHSDILRPAQRTESKLDADLNITRPSNDGKPKLEVKNTSYGFRYAAIRKPLVDPDTRKYVRTTLWIAPFWGMVPSASGWGNVQAMVPIDDEHTMFFHFKYCLEGAISSEDRLRHESWAGMRLGIDIDPVTLQARQTRDNNWLQDRAAMQRGESWSGIDGVAVEDFAVQESMGAVYDRTKEHLGSSDVAVIRMRRLMLESAKSLEEHGTPPIGLRTPINYRQLKAQEAIITIDEPWELAILDTADERVQA